MSTRRAGAQTKSAKIAADLRREIRARQYAIGDPIPSLKSLAQRFGVAEGTVLAAVQELQRDGLVESASGSGTYVRQLEPNTSDACDCHELAELRAELDEVKQRLDAIERGHVAAVDS